MKKCILEPSLLTMPSYNIYVYIYKERHTERLRPHPQDIYLCLCENFDVIILEDDDDRPQGPVRGRGRHQTNASLLRGIQVAVYALEAASMSTEPSAK